MPGVTSLIIGGLILGAAGAAVQYDANRQQAKAAKKQRQLAERNAQVQSAREERRVLRQMQTGHAYSVVQGGARGTTGSSAFYGSLGEISGLAAYDNSAISGAYGRALESQAINASMGRARQQAAYGGMLTSLGGMVMRNATSINSIGTEWTK